MTIDTELTGLHPILAAAAAKRRAEPKYSQLGIEAARALSLARQGQPTRLPELASVTDITVPGAAGPLAARLYRPSLESHLPLLVYFHGGGFVAGSLDSHDSILRRLALAAGIAILSVDYRLAPEHPFPAPVDDAATALRHALANPGEFASSGPVFAGGDSAGAALALAAAGMVENLTGLILFYPVTDLARIGDTDSYRAFGDGRAGLSEDDMRWFAECYAPDPATRTDPRCSPLLDGTSNLPPAFIATAEYDVLRSEGEALAAHLEAGDIPTTHRAATGVNHGYLGAGEAVPEATATLAAAANWLKARIAS